jgi:hypothetical protein
MVIYDLSGNNIAYAGGGSLCFAPHYYKGVQGVFDTPPVTVPRPKARGIKCNTKIGSTTLDPACHFKKLDLSGFFKM